jgi:hypothetical protein
MFEFDRLHLFPYESWDSAIQLECEQGSILIKALFVWTMGATLVEFGLNIYT